MTKPKFMNFEIGCYRTKRS